MKTLTIAAVPFFVTLACGGPPQEATVEEVAPLTVVSQAPVQVETARTIPGPAPVVSPVYPDGGPCGNDPNDCHRTSDCPAGDICWWDWSQGRNGRNVCSAKGQGTYAGCITAADCAGGLFCVYSECNDPTYTPAQHQACVDLQVSIGQQSNAGKGCCSLYSDHCS